MKLLHVSDISFAQHQEFILCTLTNGIFHPGPVRKMSTNLYDILLLGTMNKLLTMDREIFRNM